MLIDAYECDEEVIGEYDTKEELKNAAEQRIKDTDGECLLRICVAVE